MRQNKIKLCHQSIFCYIQDCFSSAVASIFSILLIRWIGAPVPGFSGIVILWTALSVLFTAIGLLLTGSYRIVGRYITPRSYLKKILTILFKALMMSVIVFVTLNHNSMVSPLLGAILALTDFIFTSLGLLSPLLLSAYTARYHHDDVCILVSRKNALVVGTDDQAVKYALDLDRTGDFNVVGLVSTDSQNDGLVINDYHVYYSHDLNEIDILGWRLGGVDCVFIPPKSGQGLLSGKDRKMSYMMMVCLRSGKPSSGERTFSFLHF